MSESIRTGVVDKDGGNRLLSVVTCLTDPTKNGIVVCNPDGSSIAASIAGSYLKLDQTTPQTVINGAPIFNVGLKSNNINIINLNTVAGPAHLTGTALALVGADNAPVRIGVSSFGIAGVAAYASRAARGIASSPSAVQTGDQLLSLEGRGYGATGYSPAPSVMVRGYAGETWTDAAQGAYLSLWTTPNTTIVPVERVRVDNAGLMTIYKNNIATTNTAGLTLANTTAATVGVPVQYSPELHLLGHRWTTDTTVDQTSEWRIYNQTSSAAATSSNYLYFDHSRAGGAYVNAFNLSSGGSPTFAGNLTAANVSAGSLTSSLALTTTSTDGLVLNENTVSDVGNTVRYSPRIRFTAHAWNTTVTAADNTINYKMEVIPVSGATTSARLAFWFDNNGGGYTERMYLTDDGNLVLGVSGASGSSQLEVTKSDSTAYAATMSASTLPRNGVTNRNTGANNCAEYVFGTFSANGSYGSAVRMMGIFTSHTDAQISGEWQLVTRNAGTFVEAIRVSKEGYVGIGTTVPTSTLHNAGSLTTAYRAITSLRTLDITDYLINCTANTFSVTLPTAANITGRTYVIKNSGTGVITVICTGAETIDGSATMTLSSQYQSITVVSNGTNWIMI